jgi:hypothetical protein
MIQLTKVVSVQSSDGQQDANGFIQNCANAAVTYTIVPLGQYYAAGLVTTAAPNQIKGLVGNPITEGSVVTYTGLAATSITGSGSSGVFTADFTDVGGTPTLTSITATTAGSGYLVRDTLRLTTPGTEIAVGKRVKSFETISAVSGNEGLDTPLTITPSSSGSGTGAKAVVYVDTLLRIVDSADYATITLGEGHEVGDVLTFNANNNDEGNTYTNPWQFTVTLTANDLSNGSVIDFKLLPGANDTTASLILPAGASTDFPVKSFLVTGTTDRAVAVFNYTPTR